MRTLNDYFLTAEIEDISTASSTFVAVPDGGKIIKIITALQGAISGGNAALSFEVGGSCNWWWHNCCPFRISSWNCRFSSTYCS